MRDEASPPYQPCAGSRATRPQNRLGDRPLAIRHAGDAHVARLPERRALTAQTHATANSESESESGSGSESESVSVLAQSVIATLD